MKKVLFTNPSYDDATRVLSHWVGAVAQYVESLGDRHALHIRGGTVTAENLHGLLSKHKPVLVTFSGHGHDDHIKGHNGSVLHHSQDNHGDLEGSIVHAIACSTAKNLGGVLVGNGTKSFVGFKDEFKFCFQSGNGTMQDPIAGLFLNPAYEVTKSIASGSTVREAWTKSQKMFVANYRAAALANADSDVLASIIHNMQNHVFLGDGEAVIG